MAPVIVSVVARLLPFRIAAPGAMMRAHVGAVTHAKQHGAARAVFVFVHLARRMHDEGAGRNGDGLLRRAHGAAAGKAEINFGGVRVAVVGLICPGSQQATVTSPSAILPRIFSTWCLGSHCCSRSRLKTCMALDLRRNEGTASLAYSAAEQERGDCAQPTRIDRRGGRARSSTG